MKEKPRQAGGKLAAVEEFCQLLRRSRLVSGDELGGLLQRFHREARESGTLEEFTHWLVANRYLTNYQVAMLRDGHIDHFFFGAYKLLERVGKGRLTRVYRGVDRLGQVVALKVLPPSRSRDAQVLAGFHREGILGQRLDHPHVVRYLGGGEEGGLHYLVLEYLDGETLQQVLARQPRLPPTEAADLLAQALAGLASLHAQGIVHRSLEPANLMLLRPPSPSGTAAGPVRAVVKVLDLTLAVTAEDLAAADPRRHAALAYMAPELLRGQRAEARSDLFSVGCILHHVLTGEAPFPERDPRRLPPRPLHEIDPEIPPELAGIVSTMMALDPAARYPSAEEAGLALQAYLEQAEVASVDVEPVAWPQAPPPGTAADEEEDIDSPWAMAPAAETPVMAEVEVVPVELPVGPPPLPSPPVRPMVRPVLLGRRDWLLLLAGASALLGVEVLGWLLGWLAGRLRRPPASGADPVEDEVSEP